MAISAVIITKNEAHIIGTTLQSLSGITTDIIIVDSGSTDNTVDICKTYGATVITTTWDGYGINKKKGINLAKNNWILNIDADETLDKELQQSINQLPLNNEAVVYECKFKNFFCGKWIRFGEWSGDRHIRLFNRNTAGWNNDAVHETLTLKTEVKTILLQGHILHYTTHYIDEYIYKTVDYAKLNAQKYFAQGKKASFFKLHIAPAFTFLQYYIFRLGFLDGWEGYLIAKTTAWYSFLKYSFLKEMYRNKTTV